MLRLPGKLPILSAPPPPHPPCLFLSFSVGSLPPSSLTSSRPPSLPPTVSPCSSSLPLLDCGCLRGCFSLRLPLMKGRTKLPSLCPCVVGRFTSLPSPSFPPLPSVSSPPSALHVSWELAGRPAGGSGCLLLQLGRLTMCGVVVGG